MATTSPRSVAANRSRTVVVPPATDIAANIALLAALWAVYAVVRALTADASAAALANARALQDFQQALGFAIESDVQSWVPSSAAFVAANTYYLLHFPFTLMVLVAAYLRDRDGTYRALRNGLIAVTGIALLVHLAVPLAPPRMLPGFVDTGLVYGPHPYSIPGSDGANQFAAMPSMHVAWSLLVAAAVRRLGHFRGTRLISLAHPVATAIVVVMTAHHFITDAAVGAALAAVAIKASSNDLTGMGSAP